MLKAEAATTLRALKSTLSHAGIEPLLTKSLLAELALLTESLLALLTESLLAELAEQSLTESLTLSQVRERIQLRRNASRVPQPTGKPLCSPALRLRKTIALLHEPGLRDARVAESVDPVHRETNLIERIDGLIDAIVQHLKLANVDFGFHVIFLPCL
jgi:hypothetical protein